MAISIILFFLDIFVIEKFIIRNTLTYILKWITAIGYLIPIFTLYNIKTFKENGRITFTQDEIIISNSIEEVYKINQIENITISYTGYDGKFFYSPYIPSFSKDGSENYISFIFKGHKITKEFYIPFEYKVNEIKNLIEIWKNNGYSIKWK